MKFSTHTKINSDLFYLAFNNKARLNDEYFGLSIGPVYWGWYIGSGLCFGLLDRNGALKSWNL